MSARSDNSLRIEPIDHSALPIAQQLHAVQMSAYAQEARLLGAISFPPLGRTVDEVRTSGEKFLAAFIEDEMVGAVGVCPDREGMGVNIASLVVAPQFQRRGIGKRLLATILAERGGGELTVQTGAKNLPALSLYAQAGFVELRRWLVDHGPLELVKLRRPADLAG
jgi:ribosomal protein S18 acetylase RimI-like enzyme